jgi:hypothetical protein
MVEAIDLAGDLGLELLFDPIDFSVDSIRCQTNKWPLMEGSDMMAPPLVTTMPRREEIRKCFELPRTFTLEEFLKAV